MALRHQGTILGPMVKKCLNQEAMLLILMIWLRNMALTLLECICVLWANIAKAGRGIPKALWGLKDFWTEFGIISKFKFSDLKSKQESKKIIASNHQESRGGY